MFQLTFIFSTIVRVFALQKSQNVILSNLILSVIVLHPLIPYKITPEPTVVIPYSQPTATLLSPFTIPLTHLLPRMSLPCLSLQVKKKSYSSFKLFQIPSEKNPVWAGSKNLDPLHPILSILSLCACDTGSYSHACVIG